MRIAIVGAGIAGLGSAWLLQKQGHAVTLFEANDYLGGHTHTVDVTLDGLTAPVDTGFLVFNDRTYPHLVALFDELGVASVPSEMSFSARIDAAGLEWAGTSVASLFAQPRSALRPDFWRMLADIARFNRETTALLEGDGLWSISLGEYLDERGFRAPLRDWYLLPMAAAIWSSPRKDILDFPLPTFVRFCHNHGLLSIRNRPQWRTVQGGGREYVAKIAARLPDVRRATPVQRIRRGAVGVDIEAAGRVERFDEVVLACHSDQARRLLADATLERRPAAFGDPLPAEPGRSAHRRFAASALAPRVGGLELSRGRRPRWLAIRCGILFAEQAAAAPVRNAGHRDTQPALRSRSCAHPPGIRVLAPAAGRAGARRAGAVRSRCKAFATPGTRVRGWAMASTRTA